MTTIEDRIRCRECGSFFENEQQIVLGGPPMRAIHKNGDTCTKNKIRALQQSVERLEQIVNNSPALKTEREMYDDSILTPEGMREAKAHYITDPPKVVNLHELAWRFVGEKAAQELHPQFSDQSPCECDACNEIMAARMLIGGDDKSRS